ncbi:MAG: carnitine dehydratase [Solirubrobacterales bacterium]|nr:carnitine dehydratase [Solirubrobacterales bacterium]
MGALDGLKVIEIAGLGPGPFCAMVLADMGAEVLRVDRADAVDRADGTPENRQPDYLLYRGRRSVAIDLKHPDGVATLLRLVDEADVLIEGFRPGVAERLGIGPDVCLDRNPRLVYGRMTGWGQDGPNAREPGHDLNYIALTGALHSIGRAGQPPTPPLNLVGDFGGGGMLLAVGVLAGVLSARATGQGQVVDAAMVDGAALLMTGFFGWRDLGTWSDQRGTNLLDSGAPYYDVYETADGEYVTIGAVEPQFYASVLRVLGLDGEDLPEQNDREHWPQMKARFAAIFRTRTREEWVQAMAGQEACFAPVLSLDEARRHPINTERGTFVEVDGVVQPAPAPRFSGTPSDTPGPVAGAGEHTRVALADWGLAAAELDALIASGAVRENPQLASR